MLSVTFCDVQHNAKRENAVRYALFFVMLGLCCLFWACSASTPPAPHDLPMHKPPQLSTQEVADWNQMFGKYGAPTPPDVTLMPAFTPDVIRNAFIRNQKEADALYGGKWMKIRGTLDYGPTNEGFGGLDVYYVGLESKGKRMAFMFYGNQHQQQLSSLKHGQTLVIAGIYTPGEKYHPKLLGCRLLSTE